MSAAVQGFALGPGGFGLALFQGLVLATIFSAFGALVFAGFLAPPAPGGWRRDPGVRLADFSLAAAVLGLILWLLPVSADLSGADTFRGVARAVPVVLNDTEFGHLVLAQGILLLFAWGLLRPARGAWRARLGIAAAAAGGAVILQAWHLHGAAMSSGVSVLLVAELLHVLAAGAWLGTLVPLALCVATAPLSRAHAVLRRYSPFGFVCVVILALSGAWQGLVLSGGWRDFGAHAGASAYDGMIVLKTVLFVVLVVFAWRNHFRLTAPLSGPDSRNARRRLLGSIARESVAGLAVVLAAAILASLPPVAPSALAALAH